METLDTINNFLSLAGKFVGIASIPVFMWMLYLSLTPGTPEKRKLMDTINKISVLSFLAISALSCFLLSYAVMILANNQ